MTLNSILRSGEGGLEEAGGTSSSQLHDFPNRLGSLLEELPTSKQAGRLERIYGNLVDPGAAFPAPGVPTAAPPGSWILLAECLCSHGSLTFRALLSWRPEAASRTGWMLLIQVPCGSCLRIRAMNSFNLCTFYPMASPC